MKKMILWFTLVLISIIAYTQEADSTRSVQINSAEKLLSQNGKLQIGGYGEVHFNQPLNPEHRENALLDVHRIVLLVGYHFDKKTQFVTELEFEHVTELYVEQAFLQYKLNNFINLRGGLLLVPMGIINEYHEPTTFHGVERPMIDKYIAPTTWREIGFGASGSILPAYIRYQIYLMNGLNGFDGTARLSGSNPFRSGRQKGAESYMSSPNLSFKAEYYGIRGLTLGLSGYFGKTQSTLYSGIHEEDINALAMADSSVIGINMLGLDSRYLSNGFQFRTQFYYSFLSNTSEYNAFTANHTQSGQDLGNSIIGYYAEIGYDILHSKKTSKKLIPFIRHSYWDTHFSVSDELNRNAAYKRNSITTGISLVLSRGSVLKADSQWIRSGTDNDWRNALNLGIGFMF